MSYDQTLLRRIIEGALLAAGEALSVDRLLALFEEHERPEKQDLIEALTALQTDNQGHGFELVEVASGWRYQVAHDLAYWVNRLWEEKPQKYSRALLETLSLIAYRQPITRSDIEEVRGVAVSSHIIKTLAEREWIKVVGHRDVPGRPSLYATTRQFLDYFGLKSLEELPTLSELKDIDSLNESLELDEAAEEQEQIAEAQSDNSDMDADNSDQDSDDSGMDSGDSDQDSDDGGTDSDPLIEVAPAPAMSLEEEVAAPDIDDMEAQSELESVGDDVGADADDVDGDVDEQGDDYLVPGSLFDSSDADDVTDEPDSIRSPGDEPQDQDKSSDI